MESACRWSLIILLGVSLLGCTHSVPDAENEDPSSSETVPADFNMQFGRGGGFTGQWTGHTIQADGTVLAWSGATPDDKVQPVGQLTTEEVADLWKRVQAVDYFEQTRQETGNVTAFMEVTAQGKKHRVSWIPSIEGIEPIAFPVEELYLHSRKVAQEAASDKN